MLDAILDAYESSAESRGQASPTSPSQEYLKLRSRLLPLLQVEDVLIRRLMPVAAATGTSLREIENTHASERDWRSLQDKDLNAGSNSRGNVVEKAGMDGSGSGSGENEKMGSGATTGVVAPSSPPSLAARREVSVTAGSAWKTAFTKFLPNRGSDEDDMGIDWNDPLDPTRMINAYGPDLMTLWNDQNVRALLKAQKLRLEEMPGLSVQSLFVISICSVEFCHLWLGGGAVSVRAFID